MHAGVYGPHDLSPEEQAGSILDLLGDLLADLHQPRALRLGQIDHLTNDGKMLWLGTTPATFFARRACGQCECCSGLGLAAGCTLRLMQVEQYAARELQIADVLGFGGPCILNGHVGSREPNVNCVDYAFATAAC